MYVGFCLVGIGLFTSFSLLGSSPGTWSSAARNRAMFSIVSWFPERFFYFPEYLLVLFHTYRPACKCICYLSMRNRTIPLFFFVLPFFSPCLNSGLSRKDNLRFIPFSCLLTLPASSKLGVFLYSSVTISFFIIRTGWFSYCEVHNQYFAAIIEESQCFKLGRPKCFASFSLRCANILFR